MVLNLIVVEIIVNIFACVNWVAEVRLPTRDSYKIIVKDVNNARYMFYKNG